MQRQKSAPMRGGARFRSAVSRFTVVLALTSLATASVQTDLEAALQPILDTMAAKYSMAVGLGVRDSSDKIELKLVSGIADRRSSRKVKPDDPFVWGSVTKVVTGTAVLRLADAGKLSLEDPIPPLIDPFIQKMAAADPTQNFTSLADLFGPDVAKVTVRDLLGMKSGVPDYDTASPTGRQPTDSFRADAYAHPNRSYSPSQLLEEPWCATGKLLFPPGVCDTKKYYNCYSSTNYVLLGLLLAQAAGAAGWEAYQQKGAFPASVLANDFADIQFAVTGAPSAYTSVRGYDTTHYNNNTGAIDITDVAGVYGGWTASDFTASVLDAASLVNDVYGPDYKLVSKEYVDQMYATSNLTGYGLSTFNLTHLTGLSGTYGVAYGHLGATYGYQSVVVHTPGLNLSLAVATNIERDYQDQPQDVFCSVYNTAKAVILGEIPPDCTFKAGYYDGGCKCKPKQE